MGKEIGERSPAARAVLAAADAALGEPLSRLCFEGPVEDLTLTENTQPAIVAVSAAIVAAVRERWPALGDPSCAAGHSLGEYTALYAAGALGLADAVRVTRLRGRAMQEAVPAGEGAMAALMGLEPDAVRALCGEASGPGSLVSPANFNAPTQIVIAGHRAAVARAGELAKARGGKVIPLSVSAPFHCALMAPARVRLRQALAELDIAAPRFDVLANVDAEPRREPGAVRDALERQVDSPVQWVATVRRLRALGVTHALELGPGKVLAGLAGRIDKELGVLSVGTPDGVDRIGAFLGLAG
jgi:[acyl-carrier-protein] S-malonyltransferase